MWMHEIVVLKRKRKKEYLCKKIEKTINRLHGSYDSNVRSISWVDWLVYNCQSYEVIQKKTGKNEREHEAHTLINNLNPFCPTRKTQRSY